MIPSASSISFPYLSVHVLVGLSHLFPDLEIDIEALVDTGFSGGLCIPPSLIPSTLSPVAQTTWTLADDITVTAPTYIGYVKIGNLPLVEAGIVGLRGQPLLGRGVTDHFGLFFDHGSTVVISL